MRSTLLTSAVITIIFSACQKEPSIENKFGISTFESAKNGGGSTVNISNGLVAYYPFNGNAKDESGNANHGTIYDAVLTTDRKGRKNSAFFFPLNSYISSTYKNQNVTDLSYCAWVKTSNGGAIIGSNANQDNPNFALALHTNGTSTGNQGTAIWVVDAYGTSVGWMSDPNKIRYNDNKWHFLTGTYSCASGSAISSSNFKLYVDGMLIQDISQNVSPPFSPINTMTEIWFGSNKRWLSFDGNLIGSIDDIRIYNRVLSQSEISYLAKQ